MKKLSIESEKIEFGKRNWGREWLAHVAEGNHIGWGRKKRLNYHIFLRYRREEKYGMWNFLKSKLIDMGYRVKWRFKPWGCVKSDLGL